jgi:hypothetical protein
MTNPAFPRNLRDFSVVTSAEIHEAPNRKVSLSFPRGSRLAVGRSEFRDEADLIAYIKQSFSITSDAASMTISRKGKYQRTDANGREVFTFGDPILDSITDAEGKTRIGATTHDFRLHAGRGREPVQPPPDDPSGITVSLETKDTVEFVDGNNRLRFHAWTHSYAVYWSMGASVETWGTKFTRARIDSQYGEPVLNGGVVGSVICAVIKVDSDEDANDDYVEEYEWGVNAPQPKSVRSVCSARWRGALLQRLVQAGDGCQAWLTEPPVPPALPADPEFALTWTPNVKIPNQKSKASPALAAFGAHLHMVHLGDSSNDLWHSSFDGANWTPNIKIPNQQSKASPALAVFGGRLHMVHLGNSSNDLWHSSFDGTTWSANVKILNQQSKASPALAAFGGRLHMVHLGSSSNDLWHSSFDGTVWTANQKILNQSSKASPALAAINGNLLIIHLGDTSNNLFYSFYDGSAWTTNQTIPVQKSKAAPALAVLNGRVHMVHLGDSSNALWQSAHANSIWETDVVIPNQMSKASPALAELNGHLHMVHLGDSSNDLWYSRSE